MGMISVGMLKIEMRRVSRGVLHPLSRVRVCSLLYPQVARDKQDHHHPQLPLVRLMHVALRDGVQPLLHISGTFAVDYYSE